MPADAAAGTYRFVYDGDARDLLGRYRAIGGASAPFQVG